MKSKIIDDLDLLQAFVDSSFSSLNLNLRDLKAEVELVALACWSLGYTCSNCPPGDFSLGDPSNLDRFKEFLTTLGKFVRIVKAVQSAGDASDKQITECFSLQRSLKKLAFEIIYELREISNT